MQPVTNDVLISGGQQRDSALYIYIYIYIYLHVSILLPIALPTRLPHNIEQNPLSYTVGPCWLSILNIAVCTILLDPTCKWYICISLSNLLQS